MGSFPPRSRNRHMRHMRFARVRYRLQLMNFLDTQGARLSVTGHNFTVPSASLPTGTFTETATNNFVDTDTITIGSRTYTLQGTLTAGDGHVHIGANFAATATNLKNAINNSGGVPGTDYNVTAADPKVTAVTGTGTLVVTAKALGIASNSIATTYTAAGTAAGAWGAATLSGGVADNSKITVTSHPYVTAEGAYTLSTTGVLPGGLNNTTLYWLRVVDANTIQLCPALDAKVLEALGAHTIDEEAFVQMTTVGSGTHTITRALTRNGVFDLLIRNSADTVAAVSSVDSLS